MEELIIAENIRNVRQRKGISQEVLAYHLEISQANYSKMERGERVIKPSHLYKIANYLEISVFELMPKSKYGTGINLFGLRSGWRRIKAFFGFKKSFISLDGKSS